MQADLSFINSGNKVLGIKHQDSYILSGQTRNIFERVQLTNLEEEKMNELTMDDYGIPKSQLLRFLHAFKFDVKSVIEYIPQYKDFEDYQMRIQEDPEYKYIEQILKSGFIYIGGKDNLFRPIIIIKTELLNRGEVYLFLLSNLKWTMQIVYKTLCHFFYSIKLQILQDYFVEQWVILLKLHSQIQSFENLEVIEYFKKISIIFSGHLFKIFIYDQNQDHDRTNEQLYFSIADDIDDYLKEKIQLVTDAEELENYLPMELIEANALNYVQNNDQYWPPLQNLTLNQARVSLKNFQLKTQSTNGNNKELFQIGKMQSVVSSHQDNSSLNQRVSMMKIRIKEESGLFLFDKDLIVGVNSYDDLGQIFDQNEERPNIQMLMSEDSGSEMQQHNDEDFKDEAVNSDDGAYLYQKSYGFFPEDQQEQKCRIPLKEDSNQSFTLFTTPKYAYFKQTEQTKSQIDTKIKQREPSLEDGDYLHNKNQTANNCCDYTCKIF